MRLTVGCWTGCFTGSGEPGSVAGSLAIGGVFGFQKFFRARLEEEVFLSFIYFLSL